MKALWWAIIYSRKKIKWMLFTVLIPEYLVGKAYGERLAAKIGAITIKRAAEDNEWEEIHAYLANMGYFTVYFSDVLVDKQFMISSHFSFGPVESFYQGPHTKINFLLLRHECWALNNNQLEYAIGEGLIDTLKVTRRQLAKLDRRDTLAKFLALFQTLYIIIQLIACKFAHLPSTQLEITTLAFSASSIITYILYWPRPQGVESRYVIKAKMILNRDQFLRIGKRGPMYLWTHARGSIKVDEDLDLVPLPNDGSESTELTVDVALWKIISDAIDYNDEIIPLAFGAVVGGTIFGGLHCLAWNFQFPTPKEALAWKICSVLTTSLPMLSILPFLLWFRLKYNSFLSKILSPVIKLSTGFILIVILVSYIFARLFLMGEIFRSLLFLPPEAFIDTWSGSFPHFG